MTSPYSTITSQLPELQDERLFKAYSSFCQFGSSRSSSNLPTAVANLTASGPCIDGARFAKFFRDTKLLSKTFTSIDVDIIFNKVKKSPSERKIDYDTFKAALALCAAKKFEKDSLTSYQAFEKLVVEIVSKDDVGPSLNGSLPESGGVYDKLTDPTLYTGSHKHRFDEEGKGLGVAGRLDETIGVKRLDKLVSRDPAVQKHNVTASMETMNQPNTKILKTTTLTPDIPAAKPSHTATSGSRSSLANTKINGGRSNSNLAGPRAKNGSKNNIGEYKATNPQVPAGSVFDRLTNSKAFTGTHKHRFDDEGKGRGKQGRTQETGFKSLENIVRNS